MTAKKTACIVQARLGSTRLPAKVLLPLPDGNNVLRTVLQRCGEIPSVDVVAAAIPDAPESDILAVYIPSRVVVVRGPERDVLARYLKAAEEVKADVILRVTSDCPLIDPAVCYALLTTMRAGRCDFAANNGVGSFALGWSCEAFTIDLLREAAEKATEPYDREHVGPYMRRHARKPGWAVVPEEGAELRPSLDTLQDYISVWNIMEKSA